MLFSGDGDFRRLIEHAQGEGCRVTVVSTVQTSPPMVADELRRQSDVFIDLADLESRISRGPAREPQAARPEPEEDYVDEFDVE